MSSTAPRIRGLPFLGVLPWLALDPVGFLRKRIGEKPYARARLGPYQALIVNDAEGVQSVLVDQQQSFTALTPVRKRMRHLFGNGLLTNDGPSWLQQRRLIQPAFHKNHLADWSQISVAESEATLQQWATKGPHMADISEAMMDLALRIVTRSFFGVDSTALIPVMGEIMDEVLTAIWRSRRLPLPIPQFVPTPVNRMFRRSRIRLDRIIYDFIAERRRNPGGQDLMALLLDAQDADSGERMNDRQVRDEIITFLLAGHETTATALAWTWYLLSLHPRIQTDLQTEIKTQLGGRQPTLADLAKLPLLEQVVNESLRLYPPAWSMARIAVADTHVAGQRIAKDTLVLMFPFWLHRSARYWQNPNTFDPGRFSKANVAERPRFAYFPFGGGLRQCPGNLFAFYQIQLVFATLLPRVFVHSETKGEIPVIPSVTMRPRDGMPLLIEAVSDIKYN